MEEGAKRRLVGAAVMVALLVIFLPMLLEEDVQSPVPDREMSIPPRPNFDEDYNGSVADGLVEPSESAFPEYEEPIAEDQPMRQELSPPALFDAPAAAEPDIEPDIEVAPDFEIVPATEPETEPVVVKETSRAPVATSAPKPRPPSPQPQPAQAPTRAHASAKLSSWVIQVASLQEHKRAYSLVQDLRSKGFPAYIEEAQVRQKLWHRVRVGPEIDRKQIESMAASLKAQTGLNVQIQRYP